MCGIVGEVGPLACDEAQLLRMMGMLTHRGPDEAGLLIAEGVTLGHVRLSIIDLGQGQQPMQSRSGRYWVVFNGEIFNYLELKKELETLGQIFQTNSDTEVLLNSYDQWGSDCLSRFNGQWAFAIWDLKEQSFFLARDRWGVRPLFYSWLSDGRTLVFGSEIKAILADDRVPREWDHEALRDIFVSWVPASNRTPLRSISQLPPGAYMLYRNGSFQIRYWWKLDYSLDAVDWKRSEESWCEEIRGTLQEACRLRLRADVPVGAYLSGGMDSSIISSLTRQLHQNELKTFSISFEDGSLDESEFQKLMAGHLGTDHHQLHTSKESIAIDFPKTIWHAETPIYRTAPVPMMQLAGLVRQSPVKVILTGEGADELFGGYDQFKEDKIRRFWASQPNSAWRKRLLERLDTQAANANQRSRAFWFAFFQNHLTQTDAPGYSHYPRWQNGMALLGLLEPAVQRNSDIVEDDSWIKAVEKTVPPYFGKWPPLSRAQYWETTQLLSGYLLSSQGDRMSMAHSIEGRYPFLDVNLFELVRQIPPTLKLHVLNEKFLLKQAFKKVVPSQILARRKKAYRAPEGSALLHPACREAFQESLSETGVRQRGLLDPVAISRLQTRMQQVSESSMRDNIGMVLAYSTHLFHDMFVRGKMEPNPLPALRVKVQFSKGVDEMASSHSRVV